MRERGNIGGERREGSKVRVFSLPRGAAPKLWDLQHAVHVFP
jgi:hypothetical protein